MGDKSKIEWTNATWNPVTGCSKVSQGCKNCYAERVFPRVYGRSLIRDKEQRIEGVTTFSSRRFPDVLCHPERLDQPLRWRKPRKIFVNSMSDLFHELVPDFFICAVFAAMETAPQHSYQILTKRPDRMLRILSTSSFYSGWVRKA